MKIGAKTLENNFRVEATADEVDVTTKPSFSEDSLSEWPNGKLNCTNRGEGKR